MHIRELRRWKWCFRGGSTLALGVAIACCGHAGTVLAQCPSAGGGAAAGGAGGTATPFGGGAAGQLGQFQAQVQMMQQMAMQAQMQRMQALAAQQRERAGQERASTTRQRRDELARMGSGANGAACEGSSSRPPEQLGAVRESFAEQAARGTERDRQVARMRNRENERRAALQERIAEREEEMQRRRQRALAQR